MDENPTPVLVMSTVFVALRDEGLDPVVQPAFFARHLDGDVCRLALWHWRIQQALLAVLAQQFAGMAAHKMSGRCAPLHGFQRLVNRGLVLELYGDVGRRSRCRGVRCRCLLSWSCAIVHDGVSHSARSGFSSR